MDAKFYTTEQVAELLQVKETTVRRWLRDGQLSGIRMLGQQWRVEEKDLQTFIRKAREEGKPEGDE